MSSRKGLDRGQRALFGEEFVDESEPHDPQARDALFPRRVPRVNASTRFHVLRLRHVRET
jgi:hypothetical protein